MILRVAPDAETIPVNLISPSVSRAGDHRQFRTHPILSFSPFGSKDSPRGTRTRPGAAACGALAAPNYVTFQYVAQRRRRGAPWRGACIHKRVSARRT